MEQLVQIAGALLILAGFVGVQIRRIVPSSCMYLILNAVGSTILAVLGYHERQWGFFLLESVWAAVSVWSLVLKGSGRQSSSG